MSRCTILIPAKNARVTVGRAVQSALAEAGCPIVLLDDFSTDDTVEIARAAAGDRLRVVRPEISGNLGRLRQCGLRSAETPFAVWLDADDQFIPGRVARMERALEEADIVGDGAELFDGATDRFIRVWKIPAFLLHQQTTARIFERNYLPGMGAIGIRVERALEVGYDSSLHGAEDLDFFLRAMLAGLRVQLLPEIGYRVYAYAGSQSRRIENQREMVRRCLRKFDYEEVRRLYHEAGLGEAVTLWGLISMAIFRLEYSRALGWMDEVEALVENPLEVLEPEGPCRRPENWRTAFQRGTLLLLLQDPSEAKRWLRRAEAIHPTPEGANNLGVAELELGNSKAARELFAASLERFPDFMDAKHNLTGSMPPHITTHPLRHDSMRSEYPPPERSS